MFSLVTALVSPHVIDVLQAKKETLVSTLQDNAHVLCLQPSSHVCMLQGEWENVKKAYAILEELYFRVQAERAVGERLKGEPPRFWPPFNEDGERPKRHHVYVYPQSAATREEENKRKEEEEEEEEEEEDRDQQHPPVMDSYQYREQNTDAISLSSDNNDNTHRDVAEAPPVLEPVRSQPAELEVISDDSHDKPIEGRYSPIGSPKPPGMLSVSVAGCASELSKLTQSYLSSLQSLPQLSPQTKEALSPVRLPPASSFLVQGQSGSAPPGFFNYSALYSHHLAALQGMKSDPEIVESVSENASQSQEMKSEPNFENRELPELKCSHCDKTYRSEARMKEHVKTHDKNYIPVFHSCPKCGKSFTYRHNMIVHLRRFHFGWQPAKRHVCQLCGMRFQKPYMLRDHEQRAHLKAPEESTGYRCTQCESIFDNKHALAGHCSKNHNVHADSAMMAEEEDYKARPPKRPSAPQDDD